MQYMPDTESFAENGKGSHALQLGGGRRQEIRPMLMRETYKMCGGTGSAVEPFMAAMEMIHT